MANRGLALPTGDCWTLGMQCGPSNNVQRAVEIALPPGSAYMLSKRAQGRTFWCSRRKVRSITHARPVVLLWYRAHVEALTHSQPSMRFSEMGVRYLHSMPQ